MTEAFECCVCYEVTTDILSCNHYMCHECLYKWRDRGKKTCPICRTIICIIDDDDVTLTESSNPEQRPMSLERFMIQPEDTDHLLLFNQWLAIDLVHRSSNPIEFNFLQRVCVRNPSRFTYRHTRYGFQVTNNTLRPSFSAVLFRRRLLKCNDMITHMNGESVLQNPQEFLRLTQQNQCIIFHVLNRANFQAMIE